MSKISITENLDTYGQIRKASEKIMRDIPKDILFSKSKEELVTYVLHQFDFPIGQIKVDVSDSIEEGCKTILRLMGIDEDFEKEISSRKPELNTYIDKFMDYFLEFGELPGVHKERLEATVKADLKEIENRIDDYGKIDFIKKGETPRNHKQRTEADFYKRCLEEKIKIEVHLKEGIENRALRKASSWRSLGGMEAFYDIFYDRPYLTPMPIAKEYFNHESINKVQHRLGEVLSSKGRKLKKVYREDKNAFYNELEKIIPTETILERLLTEVKFLPYLSNQRKIIFEEIVELYKSKKYFGFYALALTQVEGLFTDMCEICKPGFNDAKASLRDKVEIVRDFHPSAELRFDYFQYHLPNLRNRFLHYGTDTSESIEVLSKDILYDLVEVVSIFRSLNIPANHLLKLVRKRDIIDFSGISEVCFYFKTLASVQQKKQIHYFDTEVEELNRLFLPQIVSDIVYDLDERVTSLITEITPIIKYQSGTSGFEIDLASVQLKEIAEHSSEINKNLNDAINWQLKSQIEELLHLDHFIKSYKKYLNLEYFEKDLVSTIEELKKKLSPVLAKIKLIARHTKFEVKD